MKLSRPAAPPPSTREQLRSLGGTLAEAVCVALTASLIVSLVEWGLAIRESVRSLVEVWPPLSLIVASLGKMMLSRSLAAIEAVDGAGVLADL